MNTRSRAKLGVVCSWFCWLVLWYRLQWYVWRLSTSRSFTNTKEPRALTEYICKLNKALILFHLHYWISFSILTISHCLFSKATWNLNIACESEHEPYVYSLRNKFNHVYVQTIYFSLIVIDTLIISIHTTVSISILFFLNHPIIYCCNAEFMTLNTHPCYVIENLGV